MDRSSATGESTAVAPSTPPDQQAVKPGSPRLSGQLAGVIEAFGERPVRVREILEVTKGRAYVTLLILLALPFCTPIPLPGLSTPLGAVIALIGLRLALRQAPWLPERLLETQLPAKFFPQLLTAGQRILRGVEFFLRPRWTYLLDWEVLHHGYGVIILVSGFLLALPLPIPLSNLLPALTVLLLAAAMLERDGYFLIAALVAFAMTLCFFGAIFWGGTEVAEWLKHNLRGVFEADYQQSRLD